jgi:hypothetical protein
MGDSPLKSAHPSAQQASSCEFANSIRIDAPVRSRSELSFTADGNLYCSFLLKNGLLSYKTSGHGNLSEDLPTRNWGESSDTEAVHAHFCPNIEPIYQSSKQIKDDQLAGKIALLISHVVSWTLHIFPEATFLTSCSTLRRIIGSFAGEKEV